MGACQIFLRILLPSWKFFDEVGLIPKLYYRVQRGHDGSSASGEWGVWIPLIETPGKRGISTPFLNSRGNLRLAFDSLLDRLTSELEGVDESRPEKVAEGVSYQLVQNRVRVRLLEKKEAAAGDRFQFKVTVVTPGVSSLPEEDVLISRAHEVYPEESCLGRSEGC